MGTRWLDDVPPVEAQIAYGTLGTHGALEYEGGAVRVMGRAYEHALSTHGPARVVYELDGMTRGLHAAAAINDDVIGHAPHAHFLVRADGRLVAQVTDVRPGEPPRALSADVRGARILELLVLTGEHDYCHSVWLDPRLDDEAGLPAGPRVCALARTEITPPEPMPRARRCIATTVSPGYTGHLDDLLGSIVANARCTDALLALFAVDPDEECERVAARYGAVLVRCTSRARVNATVKAVLYSAAHAIDADEFVCLDGDMLVLDDLRPLFDALSVHRPASVLACREANDHRFPNLMHVLTCLYYGRSSDIRRLTGDDRGGDFTLVVNDGTFAARREALLHLDGEIARWNDAPAWVDERRDVPYRNQFVFNLALARSNCAVEIDPAYNVQLNWQDATIGWRDGRVDARWHGRPVRILHFNGDGRHKHLAWRGWYAAARADGRHGTG